MTQLFKGLERIEEARERLTGQSFMTGIFEGKPDFSLLEMPDESAEQVAAWEDFRPILERFLSNHVDPDEIERTAKIPDAVIRGLFSIGAFAMKIYFLLVLDKIADDLFNISPFFFIYLEPSQFVL